MLRGDPVHGELVTDGDSSTLTVLVLYTAGGVAVRTLAADEFLSITDYVIATESAAEVRLVADTDVAGRRIVAEATTTFAHLEHHYSEPYACPLGVVPKFAGSASNVSSCLIQGFISK